jgi:acetolactate decarboxylase
MKKTFRRPFLPLMPVRKLAAVIALSTLAATLVFGIKSPAQELSHAARQKSATIFQFSTLPALSLGLYDGEMTFGELLKHGDFGLGTFDALDGELIILKGKAWRVRADGRVSPVQNKSTTPFAAVTHFVPHQGFNVTRPVEYSALQRKISLLLPSPNIAYAIEIRGTFSRLKVRSVPRQSKPYRPLAEVVKTQSVWEWENIRGTLVGFRFPTYLSGVNLADYHFHFLSDDKQRGGH